MSPVCPHAVRRPGVQRPARLRPRCASEPASGARSSATRRVGARSREPRFPPRPAKSSEHVPPASVACCGRGQGGATAAVAGQSSQSDRQTDAASGPQRIEGRTSDSPCHPDGASDSPQSDTPGSMDPISPQLWQSGLTPPLWSCHFQRAALEHFPFTLTISSSGSQCGRIAVAKSGAAGCRRGGAGSGDASPSR